MQAVIHALQLVKVVGPVVEDALPQIIALLPALTGCCMHPRPAVRLAAASCAAALAQAHADLILPPLLRYPPCLALSCLPTAKP